MLSQVTVLNKERQVGGKGRSDKGNEQKQELPLHLGNIQHDQAVFLSTRCRDLFFFAILPIKQRDNTMWIKLISNRGKIYLVVSCV